jgi:type I restriction enzyme S subunit
MTANKELRANDDAGLPSGWRLASLSELVLEIRGGAPLKPSDFVKSGALVLPKGAVGRTGWLRIADCDQYCTEDFAKAHLSNQVDETFTIVVLRDLVPSGPSIGLMVQIREAATFVLAQGVYGFRLNSSAFPSYLTQLSNTRWYRRQMNTIMVGSTQVHVTNTAFKLLKIPLPPEPEQRAIAAALSDADTAIVSLERQIAKKRDIQQAAMQQLLTGQIRLPGLSGEWRETRLGEVCDLHKVQTLPSARRDEVFEHFSIPAYDANRKPVLQLGAEIGSNKFTVPEGAVLVSKLNPRIPRVWVPIGVGDRAVASTEFLVLRPKDPESRQYLAVVCQSASFGSKLENAVTGTTGSHQRVTPDEALKLEIFWPNEISEQIALSAVANDMDAEIALLEVQLEKTHLIKQAMMQELLTGRIRLPIKEEVDA